MSAPAELHDALGALAQAVARVQAALKGPGGSGVRLGLDGARAGRQEALLSVEDVATTLQLRPATIRAYAERGVLASVLVGNRLRFRPSDVGLWIERRHRKGGK